MQNSILIKTIGLLSILFLAACDLATLQPEMESDTVPLSEQEIPAGFNYATKNEVEFNIQAHDGSGNPLTGIRFAVYGIESTEQEVRLFSGITDNYGNFNTSYPVSSALEEVAIRTSYIGLVNRVVLPISNNRVLCDYNNLPSEPDTRSYSSSRTGLAATMAKVTSGYPITYLGSHNSQGVPDYLIQPRDVINQEFLNDVNASLPENSPVPDSHPEYLASGNQINTLLGEDGDIYVTFVHEGAGFRNVLGFYHYPASNPPALVNDIDSITVVFPNTSYAGSGGGLYSGDKVYLGHFPAGTKIGWVLFANGWEDTVTTGVRQVYSEPSWNPEADPDLQQHNVLLYDEARDLTILGFEDLYRASGSDDDFNDALFYVTSNPRSAIVNDSVTTITYTGNDSDGDGVLDPVDDYPNDPTKAYDNYYPAENIYGSLAFEDLWPNQGDYDFNDLVVDYYFTEVMNAANQVVQIQSSFVLKAIGASYENGFGFELPLDPTSITSVTGSIITGSSVTLAANGVEVNQDNAVIIAFDNAYNILNRPDGYYINTQATAPFVSPDTVNLVIDLVSPLNTADLNSPPYNPFIFINQDRAREVHLASFSPTSLAAGSDFFDTGDDNSSVAGYYKTANNLPWALDIVETLSYPVEKETIDAAYNFFVEWAASAGINYTDWYKDKTGYRNTEKIYAK